MIKILAIARNTFREAIRDRILYGFLFFAICLILFSLVIGQLSFNEEVRAVVDIGMAGISFFGVIMSIFLGITLLHKEIEKRTIYPVLSKPVSRASFMVGKYLGLIATMVVLVLLMSTVWVIVLYLQGAGWMPGIGLAMVLIIAEIGLVTAMALFFTSFSSPFLSGLFCLGIFVAGRNADLIGELGKRDSMSWMAPVLNVISSIIPNFYLFYPSGKMVEGTWASVHGQFVESGYIVATVGYSLLYATGFLLVSIVLMRRWDFV